LIGNILIGSELLFSGGPKWWNMGKKQLVGRSIHPAIQRKWAE